MNSYTIFSLENANVISVYNRRRSGIQLAVVLIWVGVQALDVL